jgi:hypothetical protein
MADLMVDASAKIGAVSDARRDQQSGRASRG